MAIMQRCCCFDNVRSGSTAAGIYAIIYSLIAIGFGGWEIWEYKHQYGFTVSSYVTVCIEMVLLCLLFISSIVLLVGVSQDKRGHFLPFMIVMPAMLLLQCAYIILSIYVLAAQYYDVSVWSYGVGVGITVLVMCLDVFCFLCVVSQYQELRDGRGRLQDIMAARRHVNVITTTTQGIGGAVIVSSPAQNYHQQGYPPQSNYPPQQSYPLPPGYTPQQDNPVQQGYPTNQGYPAQQGYPPGPLAENPPPYSEKVAS